ncbi:uncharacterized protein PV09_07777 [Verruconis gallopava]|uniref:Uncharacterized protein n=1 Tax=Verruconis gallopava TaxID=253628 RepID=A0A0D2A211_9PEZI|nr:uncharacterized protein PV09_07777 [Verruconis gallopava]KIW00798.1 hypothetical protein PV09_07777 [Verruconis gallopava]
MGKRHGLSSTADGSHPSPRRTPPRVTRSSLYNEVGGTWAYRSYKVYSTSPHRYVLTRHRGSLRRARPKPFPPGGDCRTPRLQKQGATKTRRGALTRNGTAVSLGKGFALRERERERKRADRFPPSLRVRGRCRPPAPLLGAHAADTRLVSTHDRKNRAFGCTPSHWEARWPGRANSMSSICKAVVLRLTSATSRPSNGPAKRMIT